MIITSDASLQGWGAVYNGTRTGDPWSHLVQGMHINCLELLAAPLAVKTFLKDQTGKSLLIQLDNQTSVASIYKQPGDTVSPNWQIWPRLLDVGPDTRSSKCCSRCQVQIYDGWDRLEASPGCSKRLTRNGDSWRWTCLHSTCLVSTQLPRYFSWRPDPLAEVTNTFIQHGRSLEALWTPHGVLWTESCHKCSHSKPGDSCVEGPVLVSSLAGDTVRLPIATSSHAELDIQFE